MLLEVTQVDNDSGRINWLWEWFLSWLELLGEWLRRMLDE